MLSTTIQNKLTHSCTRCEPVGYTEEGQPIMPAYLSADGQTASYWHREDAQWHTHGVSSRKERMTVQSRRPHCTGAAALHSLKDDVLFKVVGPLTNEIKALHKPLTLGEMARIRMHRQTETPPSRQQDTVLRQQLPADKVPRTPDGRIDTSGLFD